MREFTLEQETSPDRGENVTSCANVAERVHGDLRPGCFRPVFIMFAVLHTARGHVRTSIREPFECKLPRDLFWFCPVFQQSLLLAAVVILLDWAAVMGCVPLRTFSLKVLEAAGLPFSACY